MTLRAIIWCWLTHKHQQYDRSRKCARCGLYYRSGAASPRWPK